CDAECPSGKAEHGTFGETLPHEAAEFGAEGDAHGEFALAGDGAGEHEAGDVDTGDQQDKSNRDEEKPERRSDSADEFKAERTHQHPQVGIGGGKFTRETVGDGVELGLARGRSDAIVAASDDMNEASVAALRAMI